MPYIYFYLRSSTQGRSSLANCGNGEIVWLAAHQGRFRPGSHAVATGFEERHVKLRSVARMWVIDFVSRLCYTIFYNLFVEMYACVFISAFITNCSMKREYWGRGKREEVRGRGKGAGNGRALSEWGAIIWSAPHKVPWPLKSIRDCGHKQHGLRSTSTETHCDAG